MKRLVYEASFGMKKCVVDLGEVPGASGVWHLYVDNFYEAQFIRSGDGLWHAHFHRLPDWLTGDDIDVLCCLIEKMNCSPV